MFKYDIGEKILGNNRNLTILNREMVKEYQEDKRSKNGGYWCNIKFYTIKCNKCGYIYKKEESSLDGDRKCPCCSNLICVTGINDIATTDPEMVKYFLHKEDAYNHTKYSNKKSEIICPNCGYIKSMQICRLAYQGVSCNNCNDSTSYPNKFITKLCQILKENNSIKDYELEKTFKWSKGKRYDFYIILNDNKTLIIEAHGEQHYKHTGRGRTLQEEQRNDAEKCWLAYKNGINNYVQLDCSKSEMGYIKNNILNNELLNIIFDFSSIEWMKCGEWAESNLIKEVCDYWKNELKEDTSYESLIDMCNKFDKNKNVIKQYLKKGTKFNWCNYNKKFDNPKVLRENRKHDFIIVFKDGIKIGEFLYNKDIQTFILNNFNVKVTSSGITSCCNGIKKSYKGFYFCYKKDYQTTELKDILNYKIYNHIGKTYIVYYKNLKFNFNSIEDMEEWFKKEFDIQSKNIRGNIVRVLKGERKTYKKCRIEETPLEPEE